MRKTRNRQPGASGYKGVATLTDTFRTKKYQAKLELRNSKGTVFNYTIGNYETPEEAYMARIRFIDSLK